MPYGGVSYGFMSGLSGNLPWGAGSGVSGSASGDPGQVARDYSSAYNSALAQNQAGYNNIMAGYQSAIAQQTTAQQAIQAGYTNLYNEVTANDRGIGKARETAINDASAQAAARGSQQLIDRGLANSTVQSSVDRGFEADRQRRLIENDDSVARLLGEHMSNLGLAGLHGAEHGLAETTGLQGRQLDFMNSVSAKYPDAGLYASLASEAAGLRGGGYATGGGSFAGGGGPKVGYVPSGGQYYGSGGIYGSAPTGSGGGSWLMSQYGAGGTGGENWNTPDPAWAQQGGYASQQELDPYPQAEQLTAYG